LFGWEIPWRRGWIRFLRSSSNPKDRVDVILGASWARYPLLYHPEPSFVRVCASSGRERDSSPLCSPSLLLDLTPARPHPCSTSPLLDLTHLGRAAVKLSTPDGEGRRGPGQAPGARVGSQPSSLVFSFQSYHGGGCWNLNLRYCVVNALMLLYPLLS
jgi:hypothetical protein